MCRRCQATWTVPGVTCSRCYEPVGEDGCSCQMYSVSCYDVTDSTDEVWAKSPADAVESWAEAIDDEGDYDIACMGGCRDVLVVGPSGKEHTFDLEAKVRTVITYTATRRKEA